MVPIVLYDIEHFFATQATLFRWGFFFCYFDLGQIGYPPLGEFGWLTILGSPGGIRVPILLTTDTDHLIIV